MLKCEYCGSPITESDKLCPVCGADLVAAHEQIAREKDQAEDEKVEDTIEEKQEKAERRLKPAKIFVRRMIIQGIFTAAVMLAVCIYIKVTIFDDFGAKDAEKTALLSAEPAGFDEWADTKALRYKIDQYEIYAFPTDGDGIDLPYKYKRVAVHFDVENIDPSRSVSFNKSSIGCIADGMVQDSSRFANEIVDCIGEDGEVITFDELVDDCTISGKQSIDGWIAFKIPQSKKLLEFRLPNGMRIVMENPCYEG